MADYSTLTADEAAEILGVRRQDIARFEALSGGAANSSFVAHAAGSDAVVITVLDNHDERSSRMLIDLTNWLVQRGVNTPPILNSSNSTQLQFVGARPVILRPFVKGSHPGPVERRHAVALGDAMATFHAFEPPSHLSLPERRLPAAWSTVIGVTAPTQLLDALESAEVDLRSHVDARRCLIHGDLFPDNMIWDSAQTLCLLDWETAAIDWPMLDLGFAMVGLAADSAPDHTLNAALLDGYARSGGVIPSGEAVRSAANYACTVLMFHRYVRHAVRYPNPQRMDSWKRLLPFLRATSADSASGVFDGLLSRG